MKILLIESTRYTDGNRLLKSGHLYYPSLTLPLLAALTPPEHEVSITQEIFDDVDFDRPADIVGITSITSNVFRAYEIADEFRRRGVYVVMGGIHASMEPEEAGEHADTVVIGEAEETWPQFLEDFRTGIRKRIYRAERPPNLAGLPVPRWDLVKLNRYLSYSVLRRFRLPPAYAVQTSRGCRFSCDYCSTKRFQGSSGFRSRPIPDIVHEITALGAKTVFFMDDNIFSDPERAKELFRALLPLRIKWGGQGVIVAAGDGEMIRLARASGCFFVVAGLESITPAVLEAMGRKDNKVGSYEKNLRTFRKNGIDVDVSMMFGFDQDEPTVFRDACEFLIRNKAPYASWLPLTPFPGTVFYKKLKDEGRLRFDKWWLTLTPEAPKKIYSLLYTGAKMDDRAFGENLFRYYRKFYSLPSIVRRLGWPPSIRSLVTIVINLSLRRKIGTQATIVEH
jgi:radical SAM superfamily enzyme YgiQ (UPF0313 family)